MLKETGRRAREETGQSLLHAVDYMDDGTPIELTVKIDESNVSILEKSIDSVLQDKIVSGRGIVRLYWHRDRSLRKLQCPSSCHAGCGKTFSKFGAWDKRFFHSIHLGDLSHKLAV